MQGCCCALLGTIIDKAYSNATGLADLVPFMASVLSKIINAFQTSLATAVDAARPSDDPDAEPATELQAMAGIINDLTVKVTALCLFVSLSGM